MNLHLLRHGLLFSMASGVFGWVVISGPPAHASCAGPPEPSPHAFVGRVLATESADRVATVLTVSGETTQVVGTPSPQDGSMTSVDRTYVVGATYEFHPHSQSEPYEDNACTATKRLTGADVPATLRGRLAGADVGPQPRGDGVATAGALAGAVVVGVGGAGMWLRRRHAATPNG